MWFGVGMVTPFMCRAGQTTPTTCIQPFLVSATLSIRVRSTVPRHTACLCSEQVTTVEYEAVRVTIQALTSRRATMS